MKKEIGIVTLAAMMTGASASAALIGSESFSSSGYYDGVNFGSTNMPSPTTLHRTNIVGTTGFSAADNNDARWLGSTAYVTPSHAINLTHALTTGSTSAGGALLLTGLVRQSNRKLMLEPSGSTFFMSGLVSANGSLDNMKNGEQAAMGLAASFSNTAFNRSGFSLGLYRDLTGGVYLSAFAGGNTYTLGDALTGAQASDAHMIVLQLDIGAGATDILTAWYALAGSTELTLAGTWENLDTADSGADIRVFGLQVSGKDTASPGVAVDEWRFGTTLLDVTSIPEPATIGMLGLGALIVMLVRRRCR